MCGWNDEIFGMAFVNAYKVVLVYICINVTNKFKYK